MSNETDLAWAAGYIEADGSIGIRKFQRKPPGHCSPSYFVQVTVHSINKAAVQSLHDIIGDGSVFLHRRNGGISKRDIYLYVADQARGARCLKKILPYLRIKKKHARIALKLQALLDKRKKAGHRKTLTPEEIEAREDLYLQLKWLNRVPGYNLIKVEPRCNKLLRVKGKELIGV